jgi:transcriptional regulator with XRE-family HTH domain
MSLAENPLGVVEFAEALGVTRQAIDKILKGGSKEMSASNSARAAQLLNVDPVWLATGEGTAQPPEFLVRWHERRLIELFRRLPADEQDEFAGLLESRCAIHEQHAGGTKKQLPPAFQDGSPNRAAARSKRVHK